jgi:5'-3' exonuclease
MAKFLLIDTANMFYRARHVSHQRADSWDKLGFAIHTTLNSIAKSWRMEKADHVVFCLEGRSWRKDFYPPYKANRKVARQAMTEAQAEEDKLFWETFDELSQFLREKTNCTVLQHPELEADDLIAGWIQSHPEDHHCIVSTDTDYVQLLADNVDQYNGITGELLTMKGIFNDKGNPVKDKATGEAKAIPDPKWLLFEKCIRGDSSDNVFSAYPGVREKGTKKKIGMRDAFEDQGKKGYSWNNFMLQRWTDHEEVEHKVIDDYNRNVTLIDLTAQPDNIKAKIAETIASGSVVKQVPQVGSKFLKFCGKYELTKISEQPQTYADFLTATYPG